METMHYKKEPKSTDCFCLPNTALHQLTICIIPFISRHELKQEDHEPRRSPEHNSHNKISLMGSYTKYRTM